MTALLELDETDGSPEDLVRADGAVLATFDHRTQDSGNVSWIVRTAQGDLFVKTAGTAAPPSADAPAPHLDHAARVELLRRAVRIARSVPHPVLARLRQVIESPTGPMLVYDRAPGELVHVPTARRTEPGTPYRRFAEQPAGLRLQILDQLLDAHAALERAGWVACDLYDGCLMVDVSGGSDLGESAVAGAAVGAGGTDGDVDVAAPGTARLTLIDLDTYRAGPSVNDMGRMFGSSLFMAPEEFELGAPIDFRTTVFTLGRLARHFGTGLTEELADFCGTAAQAGVVERATRPTRTERWGSVSELADAWAAAR